MLQRFSYDDLCTTMTIYWVTETFVTSARYYYEFFDPRGSRATEGEMLLQNDQRCLTGNPPSGRNMTDT